MIAPSNSNWNIFRFPTKAAEKGNAAAFTRFCHKSFPVSTLVFVHDGDKVWKITVGKVEPYPDVCDKIEDMPVDGEVGDGELGEAQEATTKQGTKRCRTDNAAPTSPGSNMLTQPDKVGKYTPLTTNVMSCYRSLRDGIMSYLH